MGKSLAISSDINPWYGGKYVSIILRSFQKIFGFVIDIIYIKMIFGVISGQSKICIKYKKC